MRNQDHDQNKSHDMDKLSPFIDLTPVMARRMLEEAAKPIQYNNYIITHLESINTKTNSIIIIFLVIVIICTLPKLIDILLYII